jgi:hypothetical protein
MQVRIDVTISYSEGRAVGRVAGVLEFSYPPAPGSRLAFIFPPRPGVVCPAPHLLASVAIEQVIHSPANANDECGVLLLLDVIQASSEEHAIAIAQYLERGFGLVFESFN